MRKADKSKLLEALKTTFSLEQPLGSISALEYMDSVNIEIFKRYFDKDNHLITQLKRSPSMIIGRKGAGKTDALISSFLSKKHHPIIYFNYKDASLTLSQIISEIDDIIDKEKISPMVELVSEFWVKLFLTSTIYQILNDNNRKNDQNILVMTQFMEGLGIGIENKISLHVLILRIIAQLRKLYSAQIGQSTNINFLNAISLLDIGGFSYDDAINALRVYIDHNNLQPIILFDSVEVLDLNDVRYDITISGLLKCIGEFQTTQYPLELRSCIPAEIYFSLREKSSNVMKDFQRSQILHWHAGELLSLAAKRFAVFIEIWEPESVSEFVEPFELSNRTDAIKFWQQFLPRTVANTKVDNREDTIPYILRHTQLLPRQIIALFNEVLSRSIGQSRQITAKIDDQILTSAVTKVEEDISEHVIQSYKNVWFNADEILRAVIPILPNNIVSFSLFHSYANRSGYKNIGKIYNFDELIRMCAELGVVGRLIEDHGRYVTAVFEYSEPHKLIYSSNDILCIHPIFTERYGLIKHPNIPKEYKPVYPLGTDPNGEDRRPRNEWSYS